MFTKLYDKHQTKLQNLKILWKAKKNERLSECTFRPEKFNILDYSFTKEYKDPATRLYKDADDWKQKIENLWKE